MRATRVVMAAAMTTLGASSLSPFTPSAMRATPSDARALIIFLAPAPPSEEVPAAGMLRVPGGTFRMGADLGGEPDEHPAHDVHVGSFFLDVTEVTNGEYQACVRANACRAPDAANARRHHMRENDLRSAHQPVTEVSWDDANAYCTFVEKRLPTEAEWERASRGDDQRRFPWGNEPPRRDLAVFGTTKTADVGSRPNGKGPYGHLDLAGNVWEWVADEYDPYAYRRTTASEGKPGTCAEIMDALRDLKKTGQRGFTGSNPLPTECEHVLRGGGFNYDPSGLRSTNRVHHPGRFRLVMAGFRCAKDDDGS